MTSPSGPSRRLRPFLPLAAAALTGCATAPRPPAAPANAVHAPAALPAPSRFVDEPWSFDGRAGRAVETSHYRIMTTRMGPAVLGRLPGFMEDALGWYRVVGTGSTRPLPLAAADAAAPGERMNVFVFAHRSEWERFTRRTLGEQAGPFLRLERGGYAWGGTSALFDVGEHDTLVLAGHEGWHQFTQRAFRQPLPVWLEETLATQCEAFAWETDGAGAPVARFDPAANHTRLRQLHDAARTGSLWSVERLVIEGPGSELGEAAVTYYAQAWALGRMLREDDRFSANLAACVEDAHEGRLWARVIEALGRDRAEALAGGLGRGRGLAVLEAYFTGGGRTEQVESAYREWVTRLLESPPGITLPQAGHAHP